MQFSRKKNFGGISLIFLNDQHLTWSTRLAAPSDSVDKAGTLPGVLVAGQVTGRLAVSVLSPCGVTVARVTPFRVVHRQVVAVPKTRIASSARNIGFTVALSSGFVTEGSPI